jgi:hypothetical protein
MAGIGWAPLGGEWWTWRWCPCFATRQPQPAAHLPTPSAPHILESTASEEQKFLKCRPHELFSLHPHSLALPNSRSPLPSLSTVLVRF